MSMRLSFCVKAATSLDGDDLDTLTEGIEGYVKTGVGERQAEAMALDDLIAEVARERAAVVALAREQYPELFRGVAADAVGPVAAAEPEAEAPAEPATPAPQAAEPEAAPAETPGWHTPLPMQGEPSTQQDRTNAVNPKAPVDARKVSARLAAEAFAAITQAQQTNIAVSGMQLYPWVLPAQGNRNGVVRLLPEDQRPGAPWQQVGTEPVNAGGVRNLAINDLTARLGREPIIGDENAAATATAPQESAADIARRNEFRDRMRAYWDGTATPAIRDYLRAFDAFGADRLERNRVKPEGMSAREWLESYVSKQSTWDKGRKTGLTGIQSLSRKDLWPTEDGSGERLRKAMLEAVKALKNAPGSNGDLMAEAFMEPKAEAAAEPVKASRLVPGIDAYHYVNGQLGMTSSGSFTRDKARWAVFGRNDVGRMGDDIKPYGATQAGVFVPAAEPVKAKEGAKPGGKEDGSVALYEPAPPEYSDRYETDVFGNPLPEAARNAAAARPKRAGVRGDVQPAAGVQGDTPAPAGEYFTRTTVGATTKRRLGVRRIKTAADAAAATRYLYRSAVERFDGIVTDKDGKPLAIVGGFKGAISQVSTYPATVMGEAIRIPGAARIWFSHNHPSGLSVLSRADEHMSQVLTTTFKGSGIEPMGLLAIGNGKFGWVGPNLEMDSGDIPAPSAAPTMVPVVERELADGGSPGALIDSPALAKDASAAHYKAGGPGIILLDSQHRLVGWVPVAGTAMAGALRNTGGLNAIYRAVSEANVGAAIIAHGGELDGNVGAGVSAAQNIAAALQRVDVNPLDIIMIERDGARKSAAEIGLGVARGPVYSRAQATPRGQTDTAAFREWFGDSKVVDAEGKPLVVYHGTFSDFSKFSDRKLGENTDGNASSESYAQTARVGFWFNDRPMGGNSAGYTLDMPVYLSIQNPKREMSLDWLAQGLESTKGRAYRRRLMSEGYDGIVLKDEEFGGESWIAFRPEQIKSAIGNAGAFDPANPDIRYSRGDTPRGLTLDEAEAIVGAVRDANPTAPPMIVLESVDQAPSALLRDIAEAGASNDVEAAYHEGKVYVFAPHLKSMERAMFVIAHHELRHHGMRSLEGRRLSTTLAGMVMSNRNLRDAARAKMDAGLAKDMIQGAEEALADMDVAEVQALKGWPKVLAAVRNWLRGMATRLRAKGHTTLADAIDPKDWTDADVAGFVARAEAVSKGGRAKFGTDGTVFQRAWHGTTARGIERFSTDYLGAGTGEQAFGWGLYFGGRREVGEYYRRLLTKDQTTGQLYEVEIPEDSELLDWNKPLSEQPEGVRKVLIGAPTTRYQVETDGSTYWVEPNAAASRMSFLDRQSANEEADRLNKARGIEPGTTGADAYRRIAEKLGGNKQASLFLLKQGVPGIKYRGTAAFDRGTTGPANYVIFDGADAEIQSSVYSRAGAMTTAQDLVKASGGVFDFNKLGETKQDRVRSVIDKSRPFWLGALTRDQIADIYGKEVPQIKEYDTLTRAMENQRSGMAQKADDLYQEWSQLPSEVNDRLAKIMLDSTVNQVHPDREDPPPKATEEQKQAHARVRAAYKMMPKDGQVMYAKVRDAHAATLAELKTALEGRIDRAMANGQEKAAMLADIRKRFDQYLTNGPYFPLTRFGDFLVVANRPDGERVVASYESAGEQQAAARALEADGFSVKLKTAKTYNRSQDGAAGKFIGEVLTTIEKIDMVEATINGSRTDLKNQLLDDINQLFIRALPDMSYRKHFAHRKNTPGFSADVMRGFASSAFHSASHIARLNHSDRMTFELEEAFKTIEQAPEGDFNQSSQVLNEMASRHEAMLNPNSHPLSTLATQVGFTMYLGLSPAAGLINMMQVPMVTIPFLGARYGFGKATAAMSKAYTDIMGAKANRKSGFNAAQSPKLTPEERQAISTLQDEGVIDLTQAHDLAAATDRDIGNQARSRTSFAIARAMKIVGWTFHVPEVMNRQVTALMAYRLEIGRGGSVEAAMDAARESIKRTQFDYSSSNRARYMHGNIARVVTQFKQFSQNMTYFLGRAAFQALKGEDPEVRRIARRQILSTFAITGAMAGSLGMPGIGFFGGMLGMLAGAMSDDDEPWDWKAEYRNALADAFGTEVAEVFAKGVPRALMPAWDISGRVSLSDLWWRGNDREGQNPRESFASDMTNILGPTAGSILGWYTAADHMQRGNYAKAAEAIVPKFIRDPIKAGREAIEGVTSYTGEPLMETTGAENIGRILGFAPARVSEMYEGRNAVMNAKTAIEEKRQVLLSKIVKARMDGDAEAVADLKDDIAGFNERNPDFRITNMTITRSLMNRRRNRENTEDGIMLPPGKDALRELGRFASLE